MCGCRGQGLVVVYSPFAVKSEIEGEGAGSTVEGVDEAAVLAERCAVHGCT